MKSSRFLLILITVYQLTAAANAAAFTPEFPNGVSFSTYLDRVENDRVKDCFQIWKKVFMSVNDIDEQIFDTSISFRRVMYSKSGTAEGLTVEFFVAIGWFNSGLNVVHMPLILPSSIDSWQYQDIRKDVTLSEKEIVKIVKLDSRYQINFKDKIIFETKQAAINKLREVLKDDNLPEDSVVGDVRQQTPRYSAETTVDLKSNHCRHGQLNLITGVAKAWDDVCYIIN